MNLCGLKCVEKPSLQSNCLTSMKGLKLLIEELYLSHNGFSKMKGLSTIVNLCILDVSLNKLTSFDDVEKLTKYDVYLLAMPFIHYRSIIMHLVSFWQLILKHILCLFSYVQLITALENLADVVAGSREKLTTIYLEYNPCVCVQLNRSSELLSMLVFLSSMAV
ncbi:hypothetical protein Cgig2_030520 [Carnegiea gigantea]|uniref:Uncharacterized protein n=1 Tax=Carnegiea gigantea TaxID=171969 RepID=A0A9Q1QAQ3_9CARY|nr:hypothetical protein Cgig2_030520 [Carnegiea gigantea]